MVESQAGRVEERGIEGTPLCHVRISHSARCSAMPCTSQHGTETDCQARRARASSLHRGVAQERLQFLFARRSRGLQAFGRRDTCLCSASTSLFRRRLTHVVSTVYHVRELDTLGGRRYCESCLKMKSLRSSWILYRNKYEFSILNK